VCDVVTMLLRLNLTLNPDLESFGLNGGILGEKIEEIGVEWIRNGRGGLYGGYGGS